jgi:hypothetical protein
MKTLLLLSLHAAFCLLAWMSLILPTDAGAEFYKYKDNSGSVVITNKLADVPRKYRDRVKVIWDDELEAKDPLVRKQAAAERQREQREQQQKQQKQQKQREQREQREQQQERQKPAGLKNPNDGKTLVITIDGQTGEVIRRFE